MEQSPSDAGKQVRQDALGYAAGFRASRGHGVIGGWRYFLRSIRGPSVSTEDLDAEVERTKTERPNGDGNVH